MSGGPLFVTQKRIGKDGKVANVFVGYGEGSADKLAQAVEAAKAK